MAVEKDKSMSMSELQDLIVYYKDNLTEEYIQIDIMFAKKTASTKRLYKTWMLLCRNQDIEEMLEETLTNMEKVTQERTIDEYDLELSTDDTVQVIEEAVAFDKPLLVIGSNVEAFNVAGYFYITNRDNFNTMLNFKDVYYKIVDDNAEQIKQAELFDNAEEFIADCRNNGRYVTRLTKAILVESFKNVKDNKNKLQDIKKDYKLNLEFTDDGKIVYNKEHVNEILNLLLEHYVTSALTDKRMLAKAIEKYE